MKNKFILVLMVLLPSFVYAHTLLLNVFDNEDNTITVEGIFNTGEVASGTQIRLESLVSGKILYKKRLPDEGELTIDIPKEPYKVILNGGPGHQIVKEGLAPKEGFSKKILKNKKELSISSVKSKAMGMNPIMLVSLFIAFLLLFITIFLSSRNTKKLIKELRKTQ